MNTRSNTHEFSSEILTIAKEAGIFFIGTGIGTGLKYLFELIVARKLGSELFGIFFLGLAVFKLTEILSTLGLHRGVLRYVALYRGETDDKRTKGTIIFALRLVVIVGFIVSLLIIFSSKFTAVSIFHKPTLTDVLRLFAIGIPFTALTTILVFSTQGFKIIRYRIYIREIFEPITRICLVLITFIIGWKIFGVVTSFIVSTIIGSFLAFYYIKRAFPQIKNKKIEPFFESRKILSFSWPLLFAEFFSLIIIWINILMIGYFKTSQEVGIYSAAHRTALLGQVILLSFNAIFSPIIADLHNKNEFRKLKQLFKIVTKWIFTLSFPICLLMAFCASEILSLFGKNFTPGTLCLIILSVAQLVNSVIGTSGFLIMMAGKSKINLLNNIIIVTLNIGLNLLLIPRYGIEGAALSFLISVVSINAIMLIEIYFIFKFHPFKVNFFKPLIAGSMSIFILTVLTKNFGRIDNPLIMITVAFSIFLIIYVPSLYFLRIEEEDKIIIQKIKSKLKSFSSFAS